MTQRRRHHQCRELEREQVRRTCDPASLGFGDIVKCPARPLHLGLAVQKRALASIEIGLGLDTRGYNLFVLGEADSGKTSMLRILLNKRAVGEETPLDLCYVHDYEKSDHPRALYVPSGQGQRLAKTVDELVKQLQRSIPRTLTSDAFGIRRRAVVDTYRVQMDEMRTRLTEMAAELNLELRPDGENYLPVPSRDGEPLTEEEIHALTSEELAGYESAAMALRDRMTEHDMLLQRLERELDAEVLELEQEAVKPLVQKAVDERKEEVAHLNGKEIPDHFDRLGAHIVQHHRRFMPRPLDEEDETMPGDPPPEDPFYDCRINVVLARTPGDGAPVVFERQPTLARLVGYLEFREARGALRADHTSIRAGALQRAAGGYLVLQASDLVRRPAAWEALKRTLRDREVRIEELEEEGRPRTAGTVRPKPTPLQAKVILMGTPDVFYGLFMHDEEFARFFKVKAEFESSIPWNKRNAKLVGRFLAQVAEQEGHLALAASAVARIIEHASREAWDQRRLSTRVASFLDLLAEADYRARKANRKAITGEDVVVALTERQRRHATDEDEYLRAIREGTLLVSTGGTVVGQINGVAVYDTGDHAFGVPARITARTWVGRAGVVNIDREVELSGQIHDKGTLILIGLLGDRCAQERPLSLSASITFEQSYDMVEGDSASCAEFLALVSSLSGVPIKQAIAVTGSVDQQGEIQPVGGVNEKIEGIYRTCRLNGLNGDQGVLIPARNVKSLMLSDEVAQAIEDGKFHVWAADHIDQAIELLTGRPAGKQLRNGHWEKDSINDLVERRLAAMAVSLTKHRDPEWPSSI